MTSRYFARLGRAGIVGATLLVSSGAWAQEGGDKAVARALFDAARELVMQGKYAEACPKFEESQRLDPGVGTVFNLANCYEQVGKTATAWSLFLEVAAVTRAEGQADREKAARGRAAALEPRLSRLTVQVPDSNRIPGLKIARDGVQMGRPTWGTPLPVDPGPHVLEASAPGRSTWRRQFVVASDAARVSVEIPLLEDLSAAPAVAATPVVSQPVLEPGAPPSVVETPSSHDMPPPGGDDGGGQRTVGLIAGGVGLAGIGLGAVLGFRAKSTYDESSPYCRDNVCTQQGLDQREQGMSQASVATVVTGIGAAALVGGVVLYLTAPSGDGARGRATARIEVATGPGTIRIMGRW